MDGSVWGRRLAIAAVFATIAWAQHAGLSDRAFPALYYAPILAAALMEGGIAGIAAGLLSALLFLTMSSGPVPARFIDLACFSAAATLAGLFLHRERRQKQQYEAMGQQLSAVYRKLQENFEGMKRAERLSALGQLSAGLAHEIRNPLASIAGAASILRRNHPDDAKSARCAEIIDSECKRLNKLLTNFIDFARPRLPVLQRLRVDAVLDDVVALANHAIGRKSIHLQTRIEGDLPEIESDAEQLRQVLLNLLINAIEASSEGATVTLIARQYEGMLEILVVDEGSGVPPEHIDKLFDPFFTTKELGTGLGLPVAHQIVSQMSGMLTARRNPERGMTFSIAFPVREQTSV